LYFSVCIVVVVVFPDDLRSTLEVINFSDQRERTEKRPKNETAIGGGIGIIQ